MNLDDISFEQINFKKINFDKIYFDEIDFYVIYFQKLILTKLLFMKLILLKLIFKEFNFFSDKKDNSQKAVLILIYLQTKLSISELGTAGFLYSKVKQGSILEISFFPLDFYA